MHGGCLADAWRMHGGCMADAWRSGNSPLFENLIRRAPPGRGPTHPAYLARPTHGPQFFLKQVRFHDKRARLSFIVRARTCKGRSQPRPALGGADNSHPSLRDARIFARALKVHVVDDAYHSPKRVREPLLSSKVHDVAAVTAVSIPKLLWQTVWGEYV